MVREPNWTLDRRRWAFLVSGDNIDDEQVLLLESRSREEEEITVSMVLSLLMRLE